MNKCGTIYKEIRSMQSLRDFSRYDSWESMGGMEKTPHQSFNSLHFVFMTASPTGEAMVMLSFLMPSLAREGVANVTRSELSDG